MTKDTRTYIRVHDGMPDHPKVAGLSDRAFRLLVELWAYCSRQLTDGVVPPVVARKRGGRALTELMAAGLVRDHEKGYECHDYLGHQRSKAHVEAIKAKRREAGKKGGRPKANANQNETKMVSNEEPKHNPETEEVLRTSQTETQNPPVVPLPLDVGAASNPARTGRKRPAKALPDDWAPTEAHVAKARELGVDGRREEEKFRAHAAANDRRQVDWSQAFTQWLLNARPSGNVRPIQSGPKPAPRPTPEGPFQYRPARPGEENRIR